MATTQKNISSNPSATTKTLAYTVPASTTATINEATLQPTATGHVTLTIHSTRAGADRVVHDDIVQAGQHVALTDLIGLVLEAGDTISVTTSVASSCDFDASITESDSSALADTHVESVPAAGAAVDVGHSIFVCPHAGTVTAVTYAPDAAVTGADTNTRTIGVTNKGAAGSGSTSVASLALANGTNLTALKENALTLSGTPANLVVAAGDVLEWTSTHAASGLADPGGLVHVTIARA